MRKLCAFFGLFGALLLSGCAVDEMTTLKDVSRPYAGEYKCKRLMLGGEDMLERFSFIKLDLDYFGQFTLSFADPAGGEGEYGGAYRIDEGRITLKSAAGGEEKTFVFPYEKGAVRMELLLGNELLYAEFRTE